MIDKEKIVQGWERCNEFTCPSIFSKAYFDCEYTDSMLHCRRDILIYETLELLKELPNVVKCKDCKHQHEYRTGSCPYYTTFGSTAPDNWYCADGEKE